MLSVCHTVTLSVTVTSAVTESKSMSLRGVGSCSIGSVPHLGCGREGCRSARARVTIVQCTYAANAMPGQNHTIL